MLTRIRAGQRRVRKVIAFPPLGLAVGDARLSPPRCKRPARALRRGARQNALDRDATPANLDRIVREMAAAISPRDTFVLYAAAHGYSLNGRYYLIPQDYQGGNNPEALKARAIGQDRLQDWIANRIKAKKAVILLDTCEVRRADRRLHEIAHRCAGFGSRDRAAARGDRAVRC